MSKLVAQLAAVAALALAAAPVAALAAKPAVAPVRLDISSVDFSNPEQVAAFRTRVSEVQDQLCKRAADKPACRAGILFKVNAQLNDTQRTALAGAASGPTLAAR